MKIRRLRIESFKRFRKPLEIDGFTDGLNLFAAPNESGKSTVAEAIRAAFLERHRSGSVDYLRPWGEGSASPSVDIAFSLGDRACRLTKVFLGKKRCDLTIDGETFTGNAAEDHLAGLLGFRFASRGASAAQDMGVPGLLWIAQGTSHQITEPATHAGEHLRSALGSSLGDLASTRGDDVLQAVEAQRNALLHAGNGSPKGEYAAALKRQDEQAAEQTALRARVAEYREAVDRLAALRHEHARQEAVRPWEAAARSLAEAQQRLAAAAGLEARKLEAEETLRRLVAQAEALRHQLGAFDKDEQDRQARRAALDAAEQQALSARDAVAARMPRHAQAVAADRLARQRQTQVRSADARAVKVQALAAAEATVAAATGVLERARQARATLGERTADAAAARIDAAAVRRLHRAADAARDAATRLEVAATTVDFALLPGADVTFAGEPLTGAGSRTLLARTAIELPGIGRLEVSPGGAGIDALAAEHERCRAEQAAQLRALDVSSVAEADERLLLFGRRGAEADAAAAVLKAHAPAGIDALETAWASATGQQAAARQALAADGAEAPHDTTGLPTLAEADREADRARAALDASGESLNADRLRVVKAEADLAGARTEWQASDDRLADPRWRQGREQASADLLETRGRETAARSALDGLLAQIRDARPDLLRQDVARFDASVRQTQAAHAARASDITRLTATLETTGALGLEETAAERQRLLEQTGRRVDDLRRRARALDHLLVLLRQKRAALAQRLRAPLQVRLNHYLQILFPGASVEIGDNLVPSAITRQGTDGGESGAFDDLSMGAREQMGIVARLAYADLMAAAGRPTLLILDDALVHSDDDRLGRMKRVLYDAALRHQLLVFTCHPEAWSDMGVAVRPLG
ncbi:AAA family ATPase [Xylophilus sp. Kf1]|nr:AAA family ATPase [Xylophilus sp. Kf1]